MNEQFLQALYNKYNLSQKGTIDQFREAIANPEFQQVFFDKYLTGKGDFAAFQKVLGFQQEPPKAVGVGKITEPTEMPASIEGPAYTALPTKQQYIPGSQEWGETTRNLQVGDTQPKPPGFFSSLAKVAKTTFNQQREASDIAIKLQEAPISYGEYLGKQRKQTEAISGPAMVRYNVYQNNPLPTEEEFKTMSIADLKKRYGTSKITNEQEGAYKYEQSVGSLLDQIDPTADKPKQLEQFKSLVNNSLSSVRGEQIKRKKELETSMQMETAGIPTTFGEGTEKGFGSYLGRAIGTAAGSMGVGVVEPFAGPYKLTKGEIIDIGNKAAAEANGMTEEQWLQSGKKLDGGAAIEIGSLVSSALEYVGLGKVAAPIMKRFITQGTKEAIKRGLVKEAAVEGGKAGATEFSTEFLQSLDEQVSGQLAAGKKPEEININWDDAFESGLQGTIGGFTLGTISSVTGQAGQMAAQRIKNRRVQNATEQAINDVADTGDPAINDVIDREANIPTYDQEGQIGVPSTQQQGQTPIQEGTQPEGGTTPTETGGVLQVPTEAPGGAEVTAQPSAQPKTPVQGDVVTLPPRIQGGMERTMQYDNGTWKQKVGNELTSVSEDVQSQTQTAFTGETSTPQQPTAQQPTAQQPTAQQPTAQPPTEQQPTAPVSEQPKGPYQPDQVVYTVDKQGNVISGKIKRSGPNTSGIIDDNGMFIVRVNSEIFNTKDQAQQLVQTEKPAEVKPEETLNIESEQELRDLMGEAPVAEQPVTQPTAEQPTAEEKRDIETQRRNIEDRLSEAKNRISRADDPNVAIAEYNAIKKELEDFEKSISDKKDKERTTKNVQFLIEDETVNYNKPSYDYKDLFEKDPRLAALQSAKDMIDFVQSEYYRNQLVKDGNNQSNIEKEIKKAIERYQRDVSDLEIDIQNNPVVEKTTQKIEEKKPRKPKKPVEEKTTPMDLNAYKRYFFNKFPDKFGNLGVAMEMSPIGWQSIARALSKSATPEEIKMLEALTGKKVEPVTVPQQTEEEQETALSTSLLKNNGYSQKQIDMLKENPDKYIQIDNNILDIQTDKIIEPAGKKVEQKKKRPVTYKKSTMKEVVDYIKSNNGDIKGLLELVAGLDNKYSDLAKAMLEVYDKNDYAKLYSVISIPLPRYNIRNAWGIEYASERKIFVDVNKIAKKANKNQLDNEIVRVTMHEISHAFTSSIVSRAIGTASNNKEINKLKHYLKHGTNPNVKTLINLYLSTMDQIRNIKKSIDNNTADEKIVKLYNDFEQGGSYETKNIFEFITGSFTTPHFQELLNELKSPISPNKSIWQQFIDAIKKIITGTDIKAGSMLESVLATTPNVFLVSRYDKSAIQANIKKKAAPLAAPAKNPVTILGKIGKELIEKGAASMSNVIEKIEERLAQQKIDLNIDIYDYADKIMRSIERAQITPTEGFDAAALSKQFFDEGQWAMGLTEESKAEMRAVGVENVADFLRDKAKSLDDVVAFAKAWNAEHIERPINATESKQIWDRIKPAPVERETQTVFTDELLKDLYDKWAKGKTQGIKETTAKFRELLVEVQDTIKRFKLTPAQTNAIMTALRRVNRFSEGTYARLRERIMKIEQDATYAQKLATMRDLRSKLKDIAASKTKLADIREVAKNMLTIDISYLDEEADIDKYNEWAYSISQAVARLPEPYKIVGIYEVNDYINEVNGKIAMAQVFEIAGQNQLQLDDENGTELTETQQQRIDEVRAMADQSKESLDDVTAEDEKEQGIIDTLKNANLDDMSFDDQVMYIRVVDNFVENRGYSLLNALTAKIKANENLKELETTLRDIDKSTIGSKSVGSIVKGILQYTQLFDAIYMNNAKAAEFYRKSGIFDYLSGCARREATINKKSHEFSRAIDNINKKFKRTDLREESEQIKLTILSEFAKFFSNQEEHIAKIKSNWESTINSLKRMDPDRAVVYEKIYNGLKDQMTSANAAISYFQKNEPHVHALWKWSREELFNDEFQKRTEKNTKGVYNKLSTWFENYMPTRTTIIVEADVKDETPARVQGLGPVQSNHTKEARRSIRQGFGYSAHNYISQIISAYDETLHDIETAEHYLLFKMMVNSQDKFVNLVGSEQNRSLLISKQKDVDAYERNKSEPIGEFIGAVSDITEFAKMGAITYALGGPTQAPLQWIPTMVATTTNLGKDADLLLKRSFTLPKKFRKILDNYSIVNRGNPATFDFKPPVISGANSNKIKNALSNIRSAMQWAWIKLLLFMTKTDTNANRIAFVAFYQKSLRDQGIEYNLNTEHLYEKEESRQRAFAYADYMVNNLQTSSIAAGKADISKVKGIKGIVRNVILPMSSFAINSKLARTSLAIKKIAYSPNKMEGVKELAGVWSELYAFLLLKEVLIDPYKQEVYDWFKSLFEVSDEEEEDEKKKKVGAEFIKEINPLSIGAFNPAAVEMTNSLNYLISKTEDQSYNDFLKDESEEKAWAVLNDYSKYNDYSKFGLYGITANRLGALVNSSVNYFDPEEFEFKTPYSVETIKKEEILVHGLDDAIELQFYLDILAAAGLPPEFVSAYNKAARKRYKELLQYRAE